LAAHELSSERISQAQYGLLWFSACRVPRRASRHCRNTSGVRKCLKTSRKEVGEGAATCSQFLLDMSHLGDALMLTTSPVRINYAIFGNVEPALHAHVIPRYRTEPEAMRSAHPWTYDWNTAPAFDPVAAAPLVEGLRAELARLGTLRAA
jgi:hypothetical protein